MDKSTARLKVGVCVLALVAMLGFVSYLPAFLPQHADKFPGLSLKISRTPSQVVHWLKDATHSSVELSGIRFTEKTVDANGVSFFLETRVRGKWLRYKANLVDIQQRGREAFELLGYIVDEIGKESFFRVVLGEDLSSTKVQLKFFQTDYSPTELSLLYRHAHSIGLR